MLGNQSSTTLNVVHWHITRVSAQSGASHVIKTDYNDSVHEYEKTVQLVQDELGVGISDSDSYRTIFTNGDAVKWKPCTKFSCIG